MRWTGKLPIFYCCISSCTQTCTLLLLTGYVKAGPDSKVRDTTSFLSSNEAVWGFISRVLAVLKPLLSLAIHSLPLHRNKHTHTDHTVHDKLAWFIIRSALVVPCWKSSVRQGAGDKEGVWMRVDMEWTCQPAERSVLQCILPCHTLRDNMTFPL